MATPTRDLVKVAELAHRFCEEIRRHYSPDVSEIVKDIVMALNEDVQTPKDCDVSMSALAECLQTAAWLRDSEPEVLKVVPMLVASMSTKPEDMNTDELSDCMWQAAWLKEAAPEVLGILPAVAAQIPKDIHDLKEPCFCYTCLWAAWELKGVAPDLLKVVQDKLQLSAEAGDPLAAHVANSLSALVWMDNDTVPKELKTQILKQVVSQVPCVACDMAPKDLSRCMSAAEALTALGGPESEDLLDVVPALTAQIPSKVKHMEAVDLGHLLNAVAEMNFLVPEVLEAVPAIMAEIPGKVAELKSAKVGIPCFWAAWRLHTRVPSLLDMVIETLDSRDLLEAFRLVGAWSPWAPQRFIDTVVAAVLPQVPGLIVFLEAADLASCFAAAAKLKDVSPEVLPLVTCLVQHMQGKAADMCGFYCATCLWAAAKLKNLRPEVLNLVPALAMELQRHAPYLSSMCLSKCSYAAFILKDVVPEVLTILPPVTANIMQGAASMKVEDCAFALRAAVELKDVAPYYLEIVHPMSVAVMEKAHDHGMHAFASASCFWAAAKLLELRPNILQLVPVIVPRVTKTMASMVADELADCLWAAAELADVAPEALKSIPGIVPKIQAQAAGMKPSDLAACLCAARALESACPQVLEIVPAILAQIPHGGIGLLPKECFNEMLQGLFAKLEPGESQIKMLERAIQSLGKQDRGEEMHYSSDEMSPSMKGGVEQTDVEEPKQKKRRVMDSVDLSVESSQLALVPTPVRTTAA